MKEPTPAEKEILHELRMQNNFLLKVWEEQRVTNTLLKEMKKWHTV